jgi:molecular chaperone GrpE
VTDHDPAEPPEPAEGAESSEEATFDPNDLLEEMAAANADKAVAEAEAVLQEDLARIVAERDEFRSMAQRIQAEFENYRKRVIKQQTEHLERAGEDLVEKLLPVLDACEAAVSHGADEVEPIYTSLLTVLEKEGLERLDPTGEPFDPNVHEAVMHEAGEADHEVVAEVFRTGYVFKGRLLRAAMVKVAG